MRCSQWRYYKGLENICKTFLSKDNQNFTFHFWNILQVPKMNFELIILSLEAEKGILGGQELRLDQQLFLR